jgi:hypothetical protein
VARWRRLWHLPSLCVGGVRGRRARRPSELQAKSPRSRQSQLSACCQCARTAPPAPSGTSRRRVGRATRAIFRPASPSQWDLAKLPLGGADAPTRSPSGSFASPSGSFASPHVNRGKDTHGTTGPESGTRGMRGSKPAGFSGVGERAARSLDRVSRRRGPRRAAGASLEQRDLLDDVRRVREHSRGNDAGEVVGEVVRRVEAAVGGAVAPALPA